MFNASQQINSMSICVDKPFFSPFHLIYSSPTETIPTHRKSVSKWQLKWKKRVQLFVPTNVQFTNFEIYLKLSHVDCLTHTVSHTVNSFGLSCRLPKPTKPKNYCRHLSADFAQINCHLPLDRCLIYSPKQRSGQTLFNLQNTRQRWFSHD